MTVSNLDTFNLTGNQIVTLALQHINVLAADEIIGPSDLQFGLFHLNMMIKAWQNMGIHLWTQEEACVFLNVGQPSYAIGTDHACLFQGFYNTTIASVIGIGQSIIPVISTLGFLVGDQLGIQLDNGTRFWSTITMVNSLTTVTIASGLTGTAAIGNTVFDYTTTLPRPLKIHNIRRWDLLNQSEIEAQKLTRPEYFNLPQKLQTGLPINWYYDPQLGNGELYIYQPSSDINQVLRITATRAVSDFTNSNNTVDFPNEWTDCIVMNLAVRLSHPYGKAKGQEFDRLLAVAGKLEDAAKVWDIDTRSIQFVPKDY